MQTKKFVIGSVAGLLTAGLVTILSLSTTSCGTLGGGSGSTNSVWADTNFVANTAFALKATVANGTAIGISEDTNAIAYLVAVRDVLAKFKGGSDYTPGALETALSQVSIKELHGKYAQLIIVNLDLIYETYWGQMVRDGVNSKLVAAQLIQAAIDGIDLGLTGKMPAPPARLEKTWRLQRKT